MQMPDEMLADAMVMVMNELAEGNTVNDYVKAKARIAVEPFLLDDYGELPDLEWAQEFVRLAERTT